MIVVRRPLVNIHRIDSNCSIMLRQLLVDSGNLDWPDRFFKLIDFGL